MVIGTNVLYPSIKTMSIPKTSVFLAGAGIATLFLAGISVATLAHLSHASDGQPSAPAEAQLGSLPGEPSEQEKLAHLKKIDVGCSNEQFYDAENLPEADFNENGHLDDDDQGHLCIVGGKILNNQETDE